MSTVYCRRCGRGLEFSGDRPKFCAYCGQPLDGSTLEATIDYSPDPAASPRPAESEPHKPDGEDMPDRLAGYRLIRKLGDGGMGTVYEAEEESHGRHVAVKVLASRFRAGAEAIERFRQEGRLASTISHPRCVFVLAADEFQGRPYIVMELMTGATLQSVIEHHGPMPVEEAVAKILDVVEGLMEAHRLGVIHRDVKPSNCFLEADGRVKVGDFGLSKSLSGETRLTRTGSFIGTPLYASPEQIKGEPVDVRTDVYSVAATLYFLLTARPPFEAPDAAAALARIVSETPRPLRELRSEVPAALDAVILRGMDRDRERRYRSMAEFREVLLPFAPRPIPDAGIGPRVVAFLLDQALIFVMSMVLYLLLFLPALGNSWGLPMAWLGLWLAYYVPQEGLWGGSLGKRLLRLRVLRADCREEPGPWRAFVRALTFYVLVFLPGDLATTALEFSMGESVAEERPFLYFGVAVGLTIAGLAVMAAPMRRRNSDRGVHEWLSGTRTARLPRSERRREAMSRRKLGRDRGIVRPVGVLQRVGPYRIRGAVRWEPSRRVLSAQDSVLGREVWVVLRPRGSEPPDSARRELNRATRARWISGGELTEGRWDAYVAPAGCPLADLAGPDGLIWVEARPILVELAEELSAAIDDGTLPEGLTVDQVWVEPDGRVQLIDPLGTLPGPPERSEPPLKSDDRRGLDLLARAAALALEGGRRLSTDTTSIIRSPVPQHAREVLDRLTGNASPFDRVAQVRDALRNSADEPDELGFVPRVARVAGYVGSIPVKLLLILILSMWLGDFTLFRFVPSLAVTRPDLVETLEVALLSILIWPVVAALTRARLFSPMLGAVLVREDGLPPSRFRCALREIIIWLPLLTLLFLARVFEHNVGGGSPVWVFWSIRGLPLLWLTLDSVHELAFPGLMLHDRLSRTRLVPL